MYGVKAWRQLHKNAASNIKQVLEAAPYKGAPVRPFTTHHKIVSKLDEPDFAGRCWRSRDEHRSDILLWIPSHGRAKAGRIARTYIQQLCADIGCILEDLQGAMDDREGWRERVWKIHAGSATWWWWWWWWNFIVHSWATYIIKWWCLDCCLDDWSLDCCLDLETHYILYVQ